MAVLDMFHEILIELCVVFFIQQACVDLNIDIITLDVTEKSSYKMKRQPINAVSTDTYFYTPYSSPPTKLRPGGSVVRMSDL